MVFVPKWTNRYAVVSTKLAPNSHVSIKLWYGIRPQMINRYAVDNAIKAINSHV